MNPRCPPALIQSLRRKPNVAGTRSFKPIFQVPVLPYVFAAYSQAKQYGWAKETLLKMDDTSALVGLYVEQGGWDDAFLLLHAHPGKAQELTIHFRTLCTQFFLQCPS
jgi:hypothetical protein